MIAHRDPIHRDDSTGTGGKLPRIRLHGIHRSFGEHRVLRGIDLELREGENLVIVGRSGEGKSVLLKIIDGLLEPDQGEVWIDETRVDKASRRELNLLRRRIAMVFQGSALFDSMTVEENVAFPYVEAREYSRTEIRERVVRNLRRVRLTDPSVLEKKPAELSGGMRKRVGVARALSMEPEIILWDEPTTGLDPVTSDAINDLILTVQQETKATSIVVTHDMKCAFKVGNRIALLHRGRFAHDASVKETERTDSPLVRQFINGDAAGPLTEEDHDLAR
jgi:phospholipid/cholesterol/gamma-HCH transport system ATP-binding protein